MEIKANELRIGNHVQIMDGSGLDFQPAEITSIKENSVSVSCKPFGLRLGTNYQLENITPIPLTEEELLNLGFRVDDVLADLEIRLSTKEITHKRVLGISENSKGIWSVGVYSFVTYKKGGKVHVNEVYLRSVRYVHEIQNLYFALEQEELQRNPTSPKKQC